LQTPTHGLTTYPLQILYISIPIELVTICGGEPMSTLKSLSIHMLMYMSMSFFVTYSKACDSMFAQFIGYALLKLLE
jgi:hypothetical protein